MNGRQCECLGKGSDPQPLATTNLSSRSRRRRGPLKLLRQLYLLRSIETQHAVLSKNTGPLRSRKRQSRDQTGLAGWLGDPALDWRLGGTEVLRINICAFAFGKERGNEDLERKRLGWHRAVDVQEDRAYYCDSLYPLFCCRACEDFNLGYIEAMH